MKQYIVVLILLSTHGILTAGGNSDNELQDDSEWVTFDKPDTEAPSVRVNLSALLHETDSTNEQLKQETSTHPVEAQTSKPLPATPPPYSPDSKKREKTYTIGSVISRGIEANNIKDFQRYWRKLTKKPEADFEWMRLLGATEASVFIKRTVAEDKVRSLLKGKGEIGNVQQDLAKAFTIKMFIEKQYEQFRFDHESLFASQHSPMPSSLFSSHAFGHESSLNWGVEKAYKKDQEL